jgi:NarL family two-component system response regulator LiaR
VEIAAALRISEATVRTHVSHILGKLQLSSRTQAALYALREGLATLHEPKA